jgi:8-oxo-dGTP pyrophosphatase MutT (NUDIX family)
MSAPSPTLPIKSVEAIRYRLIETPWRFAQERAEEIEAHWQKRRARTPDLYNGRVLLMHRTGSEEDCGAVLEGTCFEADYKSFTAWRDFGFSGEILNVFAMAALRSADGAFLLGEMGPNTASAGKIYFPAGTPEPSDLKDGLVDFEGSARRELKEETGIDESELSFTPGWSVVFDGAYVACMKRMRSPLTAAEIVARTDQFLARDKNPELTRLKPVISVADFDAEHMPAFMRAYLQHALRES